MSLPGSPFAEVVAGAADDEVVRRSRAQMRSSPPLAVDEVARRLEADDHVVALGALELLVVAVLADDGCLLALAGLALPFRGRLALNGRAVTRSAARAAAASAVAAVFAEGIR